MRWVTIWIAVLGCSSDGGAGAPRVLPGAGEDAPQACGAAQAGACACEVGASQGVDGCGAACPCEPSSDAFGNSEDAIDTTMVAPQSEDREPRAKCEPGLYLGQYQCDVTIGGFPFPLTGDVSFNLAVNEEVIEAEQCQEFCADLVIAEGTGTLFGLAGLTGFEAQLEGGLDCQTGEFRASAPTGVYGAAISSNPADPNALWTVQQPPLGTFMGSLEGVHTTDAPQQIEGSWDLSDMVFGASCVGPFTVVLQP